MSGNTRPDDGLPLIEFTRVWSKKAGEYAYRIKIFHTDKVDIPIIITDGRQGIGMIHSLKDGKLIKKADLKILVTEATGYIFDIINPVGTEEQPEATAEFKKMLEQAGGADELFKKKHFQNEDTSAKKSTPEEALKILNEMQEAAERDFEAEEAEEEEPDLEKEGL